MTLKVSKYVLQQELYRLYSASSLATAKLSCLRWYRKTSDAMILKVEKTKSILL